MMNIDLGQSFTIGFTLYQINLIIHNNYFFFLYIKLPMCFYLFLNLYINKRDQVN